MDPSTHSLVVWALLLSYAVFSFGPYLLWPSRWNFYGHFQLGLFPLLYIVPLFILDSVSMVRPATARLYMYTMLLGAACYLSALPVGFKAPRFFIFRRGLFVLPPDKYARIFQRRVVAACFVAMLGLVLSFAAMGYIPMFTEDPLQAKYFHGEYRAGYLRAAVLFRLSYAALVAFTPLLMVVAVVTRRWRYWLLVLSGSAVAIACLARGPIGIAWLLGLGIIVAASKRRFALWFYLIALAAAFLFGALANFILSSYFDVRLVRSAETESEQISELVNSGAPRLIEGLAFFDAWRDRPQLTYGRNFVGGLVPLQFRWNPGLWPLGVLLGTDDPEVISNGPGGGLALAVPISGYTAFGWSGVIAMSLLSGFFSGYIIRFAKTYASHGSVEQSAIVSAMLVALTPFASDPCAVTLQLLPPVVLLAWLIYPVRISLRIKPAELDVVRALA